MLSKELKSALVSALTNAKAAKELEDLLNKINPNMAHVRVVVGSTLISATTDYHIICSQPGGGAFTLTLPSGVHGLNFVIGKSATDTSSYTILPTGTDTLDANIQLIFNDNEPLTVTYDSGTHRWYPI